MKKLALLLSLIVVSGALFAEEEYISLATGKPIPKNSKFTLEQYKARDLRVLKKTGGFIQKAAEGPLAMLLDTREKNRLTIDEVGRVYKLATHLDVLVAKEKRGDKAPLAFAQEKMANDKPLMIIAVVEKCPELPALSVFPEERIGIVNADKLQGGDDPSLPEIRVSKEIWRAIGFVGGIGFSPAENDIMQPYYTLKELDDNRYPFIQPMNMAKMQRMHKRFGVKKARRIPYRVAVMEGWAASPTNKYQKAIWDEIHAMPTEPIKIKPEEKKVKE